MQPVKKALLNMSAETYRRILLALLTAATWLVAGLENIPGVMYIDACQDEVLPWYFGSPFIHLSNSLATSMAFNIYGLGFLLNTLIWSVLFYTLYSLLARVFKKLNVLSGQRTRIIILSVYAVLLLIVLVFFWRVFVFHTAWQHPPFEAWMKYTWMLSS